MKYRLPKLISAPGRPLVFALCVGVLFMAGLGIRSWTWEKTRHLRFQHDIVNGFYWGRETLNEARRVSPDATTANSWTGFFRGYWSLYDRVQANAHDKDYRLDYPPLRLLVMSLWAKHVQKQFPGAEDGKPEYVEPLLNFNLACEVLSAVGIFLLVRLLVNRASGATISPILHRIPHSDRGWICGAAAGLCAWLDPSLILDAHGWPQWDVWILPFYIFAALAAVKNRWFSAGMLLAIGAMLKGQLLLVVPFFVLWPLWQRRFERIFSFLSGFAMTVALIVSPWLLQHVQSVVIVAVVLTIAGIRLIQSRPPNATAWFGSATTASILLAGALTGGSFAWLKVGFLYGTERYPFLFISSCYNLPSLLADAGFSLKDFLWSAEIGGLRIGLTMQWFLRFSYVIALSLCALGAARHSRNRDPRILMALACPWLVMFALLGQMHERYLLWGGVVTTVAIGVSLRGALLSLVISLASTAMIAHVMLLDKKLEATGALITALNRARPYASWVVLLCVGFYLWDTLSTRRLTFRPARRSFIEPALDPQYAPTGIKA